VRNLTWGVDVAARPRLSLIRALVVVGVFSAFALCAAAQTEGNSGASSGDITSDWNEVIKDA